jgi:hypothetical protein
MPFAWGHQTLEVLNKIAESIRKPCWHVFDWQR